MDKCAIGLYPPQAIMQIIHKNVGRSIVLQIARPCRNINHYSGAAVQLCRAGLIAIGRRYLAQLELKVITAARPQHRLLAKPDGVAHESAPALTLILCPIFATSDVLERHAQA